LSKNSNQFQDAKFNGAIPISSRYHALKEEKIMVQDQKVITHLGMVMEQGGDEF